MYKYCIQTNVALEVARSKMHSGLIISMKFLHTDLFQDKKISIVGPLRNMQYPPQSELPQIARQIRQHIINMLLQAGSGHSAGSLSLTDVLTALYFGEGVLNHRPKQPNWSGRDFCLLSNGHVCPALYTTLAQAGYFSEEELFTLRQLGSRLQGHPHYGSAPGVENTSGLLGQGLSQAIGLATALKIDNQPNHVFCLTSDGEHQEGQTWEAYLYAGARQLNNLTVIIDRNHIQIDGFTEEILPLQPLKQKLLSFRWLVKEVDGHNLSTLVDELKSSKSTDQPTAIIAQTVAGKDVDFMEGLPEWHGQPPSLVDSIEALQLLRSLNHKVEFD